LQKLEGNFRKPNYNELKQLAEYLIVDEKVQPVDLEFELSTAFIVMIDDYTTFYPGYAGKVMIVVWGVSPYWCDTFVWSKDKATLLQSTTQYE
jgi:hypothetical protein